MMQQFRTEVPRLSYPFHLDHSQAILGYGSCFAEHMTNRLSERKFQTLLNPFGITYHPLQVAEGLTTLLDQGQLTAADLFAHRGLWQSFKFHSRFSNPDQATALAHMNQSLANGQKFLKQAKVLIVTLGTAYGFIHLKTQKLVNNCHKLPAKAFQRKLFRPGAMLEPLRKVFEQLRKQQPALQVVLTVSPIRHIKDGMIHNQRSKAALLLLAADLEAQLEYVHYFPAYELVMDDLRDYRFYDADMLHPTEVAIEYIWSYFQETLMAAPTRELLTHIEGITRASKHRPFHPQTEAHQAFIRQQLAKIEEIQLKHPALDFSREKQQFTKHLR